METHLRMFFSDARGCPTCVPSSALELNEITRIDFHFTFVRTYMSLNILNVMLIFLIIFLCCRKVFCEIVSLKNTSDPQNNNI